MTVTIDEMKAAQFRERMRLLYVAMTRAEKWLMVAAAGDLSKDGNDWFQVTQTAMGHINAVAHGDEGMLRFQEGDWDSLPAKSKTSESAVLPALEPVFATSAASTPQQQVATLSPSDLGGAKALPGEAGSETDAALNYGSLVHLLLENDGVACLLYTSPSPRDS